MTSVEKRQMLERRIARKLIRTALEYGFSISVFDGEELTLRKSISENKIMHSLMTTDEDTLIFYKDGKRVGFVWLVYGNSGWDVISDYTTGALDNIMEVMDSYTDQMEIIARGGK